jgi:hypothetical protein
MTVSEQGTYLVVLGPTIMISRQGCADDLRADFNLPLPIGTGILMGTLVRRRERCYTTGSQSFLWGRKLWS